MSDDKRILTGDILSVKDFDPMGLDITYIQNTIKEIPEDGLIDINNAERLATIFLRCADYCADLVARSARFFGHKETLQKSAKTGAIYKKIKEKITPTVAKEAYADDDAFIKASNETTDAEALLRWLTEKHGNLIKAHILCKNILTRHVATEKASGWQGSESEKDYTPSTPKRSDDDLEQDPLSPSSTSGEMKVGFVDF